MEEINLGHRNIKKSSSEELLSDFIKDCQLRGMTNESIRRYKSSIGIFLDFLKRNKIGLLSVNRETLRDFISYLRNERNNLPKTLGNNFAALSSFYEYLAYEEYVPANPVLPVRKRYLRQYKADSNRGERQSPSVEEMAEFIESIPDTRDKAIALLLAKTGIRRGELIHTDVDDVNIEKLSIILKETKKRSNRVVFFDEECARLLARWLEIRASVHPKTQAVFINNRGGRLEREGVYEAITRWAKLFGLHNPKSPKLEERFSPHCFRHWFTTQLIRANMRREYIQELRGDARKDAIDIYNHIDKEELKKAYLAHIPRLDIT